MRLEAARARGREGQPYKGSEMVAKRYGRGGKRTEKRLKRIFAEEREGDEGPLRGAREELQPGQIKGPIERSREAGADKQENN